MELHPLQWNNIWAGMRWIYANGVLQYFNNVQATWSLSIVPSGLMLLRIPLEVFTPSSAQPLDCG